MPASILSDHALDTTLSSLAGRFNFSFLHCHTEDSCKDTIDHLVPNHEKPRSRRGRGVCWKGKGAGLDRYQLAFGLDDANFSIADLEEGAKLCTHRGRSRRQVFPGHIGTRRGVRYNITI